MIKTVQTDASAHHLEVKMSTPGQSMSVTDILNKQLKDVSLERNAKRPRCASFDEDANRAQSMVQNGDFDDFANLFVQMRS